MTDNFRGKHSFLSNFYPSVEHAFQAAKTLNLAERENIRQAHTSSSAKRLGRLVKLRPQWEDMKVTIMMDLVRAKFQDEFLRAHLLATGDEELVEGNEWGDTFWGVCKGVGWNQLGEIPGTRVSRTQSSRAVGVGNVQVYVPQDLL